MWDRRVKQLSFFCVLSLASLALANWCITPEMPGTLAAKVTGRDTFTCAKDCEPSGGGCSTSNWCNANRQAQLREGPTCCDDSVNEACTKEAPFWSICWDDTGDPKDCYGRYGLCDGNYVDWVCTGDRVRTPACGNYIDC